jgi:hypothetical protein
LSIDNPPNKPPTEELKISAKQFQGKGAIFMERQIVAELMAYLGRSGVTSDLPQPGQERFPTIKGLTQAPELHQIFDLSEITLAHLIFQSDPSENAAKNRFVA